MLIYGLLIPVCSDRNQGFVLSKVLEFSGCLDIPQNIGLLLEGLQFVSLLSEHLFVETLMSRHKWSAVGKFGGTDCCARGAPSVADDYSACMVATRKGRIRAQLWWSQLQQHIVQRLVTGRSHTFAMLWLLQANFRWSFGKLCGCLVISF